MSNAMIVNAAPVARAIAPARVVAGRRLPAAAPVASSRKLSIVSTAVMGRSGSSRTVVAAAFNFKNPFGGNSDEEDDAEEEAGGDSDTVEGNPFLSKSSVDEDSSSSSAPDPLQALMDAGTSALQFGVDVADTAATVAQAAERGGLMPLLFRAVTGRWRSLHGGRTEPPAGLLAPPEGVDDDAP